MDIFVWVTGVVALVVAIVLAVLNSHLKKKVVNLSMEIAAGHQPSHQPSRDMVDAAPAAPGTWGRFWDRWEWKPMRLPLILIVLGGAGLLWAFQAGFFDLLKALIAEVNVGSVEWWGLAFGFFGACVATFSGAVMLILGIGANLSQDSPPKDEKPAMVSEQFAMGMVHSARYDDRQPQQYTPSAEDLAARQRMDMIHEVRMLRETNVITAKGAAEMLGNVPKEHVNEAE